MLFRRGRKNREHFTKFEKQNRTPGFPAFPRFSRGGAENRPNFKNKNEHPDFPHSSNFLDLYHTDTYTLSMEAAFKHKIRKALIDLDMTTTGLAAILGVSRSTVARRLSGRSDWKRLERERLEWLFIAGNKRAAEAAENTEPEIPSVI